MTYSFYPKPIIALGSFEVINNLKLFWMSSLFCSCHMPTYLMPRFGAKNVSILHIYLTRVLNIMIWFLSQIQDILQLFIMILFHFIWHHRIIRSFLAMSKIEIYFYILHISSNMPKLTDYFMLRHVGNNTSDELFSVERDSISGKLWQELRKNFILFEAYWAGNSLMSCTSFAANKSSLSKTVLNLVLMYPTL